MFWWVGGSGWGRAVKSVWLHLSRSLALLTLLLLALSAIIYVLGYHGQRDFRGGGNLPSAQSVAEKARQLVGTPYDPFMGGYGNIGASAGFIVCSDVPNIAYGLAGVSLREMLEKDFAVHPRAYDSRDGNRPGNPFFHRRARNLYAYFKANGRLLSPSAIPTTGDLVFYRSRPGGSVSHVALVTEVGETGFRIVESAPKTVLAMEIDGESPMDRGWLPAGFGRMYAHENGQMQ
jgi:uncharacterized protein YijF (DUF1287 family)